MIAEWCLFLFVCRVTAQVAPMSRYEYDIRETEASHICAQRCLAVTDTAFAYSRYEASIVSPLITKSIILVMRYDSATSKLPYFGVAVCRACTQDSTTCSVIASLESYNALLTYEGVCTTTMDLAVEVARLYVRCMSLYNPYRFGCFFVEELTVLPESVDFTGGMVASSYPSRDNFLFGDKRISHWINCRRGLQRWTSQGYTAWDDEYTCVRFIKGGGYRVTLTTAVARDAQGFAFICGRWGFPRDAIMLLRWEIVIRPAGVSQVRVTQVDKHLHKHRGCFGSVF